MVEQVCIVVEKAFFDPSLLELLYFPEDQKWVLYYDIAHTLIVTTNHCSQWAMDYNLLLVLIKEVVCPKL